MLDARPAHMIGHDGWPMKATLRRPAAGLGLLGTGRDDPRKQPEGVAAGPGGK